MPTLRELKNSASCVVCSRQRPHPTFAKAHDTCAASPRHVACGRHGRYSSVQPGGTAWCQMVEAVCSAQPRPAECPEGTWCHMLSSFTLCTPISSLPTRTCTGATHSCASQPLRVGLVAQAQQIRRSDCGAGRLQALQCLRPEELLGDGDESRTGGCSFFLVVLSSS